MAKKSQKATEASFRATHFLIKKKKAFSDGEVVKEAMMIIANTVLKDEKNGTDLISTLSDVQLGASTMVRRVSAMSGNLADQLDRDLAKCSWFNIQCDESVDSSSIAQLLVFIRMVFEDFSTREELLTLLPLKTATRGVDIYNTVKEFLVQKKVPLEKLVAVTTDGAPSMIGRHTGFIAHCKSDPDFPKKVLHFPSVQSVLKDNASASETFDKVAEKYCEVINRLGQEFENRFCDLHQLEPCVSFISNPFMNVDTTFFAEQLSATFNLDAGQVEIEIITLQNDLHLKAYQAAPNFWCLVDTEKYSGVCTAAMKVASLFGSTNLCESAFSDMNFIKNKHGTLAVSSYTPDYNTLVNSMQCQSSH